MGVYDSFTTTNRVLRKTAMKGWYVPGEKLWQIPLINNVRNIEHQAMTVSKTLLQILTEVFF